MPRMMGGDPLILACTIGVLLFTLLVTFVTKLYQARSRFLQMRRNDLPMPPYSPILGHLPVVARLMSTLPKDSNNQYLCTMLRCTYPDLGPTFYLDTWPFGAPMLVVSEPSALHQITQEYSLPKHPDLREFLRPLTSGMDIVTMEGQMWKTWRNIYNPGFSLSHLMTLVPVIVKETLDLCDLLRIRAEKKEVFRLKHLTDRLAIDVIGNVVLDTQLNTQHSDNKMVMALKRQIRWLVFGSKVTPWDRWNPLRPLVHWYSTHQINTYLSIELDRCMVKLRNQGSSSSAAKSIVGLALQTYLTDKNASSMDPDVSGGPEASSKASIDTTFRKFAINQIKLFLFSGHDTTSSTICYVLYLLANHPKVLARVREEHTQLFGVDHAERIRLLENEPHLLNRLSYSTAIIKETLRLFPSSSSIRGGEPGHHIRSTEGGPPLPTDGFLVWAVSYPLHHDPTYWPQAEEFIPERWLVNPGDPLYPVKGAWRPFEHGPRNCIGQELAMLEMKVVMVLALQIFDMEIAYEDYDHRRRMKGSRTVNGRRAYQTPLGGPSEGLPCRVKVIPSK